MLRTETSSALRTKSLAEQKTDFTFEGAPPPGRRDAPIGASCTIDREHWAALFDAVTTQLRLTVEMRPARSGEAQVLDAGRLRARVLDCVAALELLKAARLGAARNGNGRP